VAAPTDVTVVISAGEPLTGAAPAIDDTEGKR
jgi:hypothetical protein